ncbi:YozQ family protein [Robertmurraya kyonggiensis]|uniref:DUF4025 domain-containing protein n=1 Tax=Robertmurraya kyonggiensis TaxID=1037680 RepID=A0A4U1DCI3_9BACI|nr:YozQ family protein [Robertmurraya kyonggiensis]TKC19347.1 DUF4025 domain-containing protein [Robertmurraya kyonggiensis]
MKDNKSEDSSKLANRHYSPDDYNKNDQVSSGLATTHEQVNDSYVEGEIESNDTNK